MVQPDKPHCWSFDSSYSEIECMSLFFSNSLLERISSLYDEMAAMVRLATGTPTRWHSAAGRSPRCRR